MNLYQPGKYYRSEDRIRLNGLLLLLILVLSACSDSHKCEQQLERHQNEITSLKNEINQLKNSPEYNFVKLLKSETGSSRDSVLLPAYRKLVDAGGISGSYAMSRIYHIANRLNRNEFLELFEGKYLLKPIYKRQLHRVTDITLDGDSIFLGNDYRTIASAQYDLINTSDEYKKGEIIVENFVLHFIAHGGILLFDRNCSHCDPVEYMFDYRFQTLYSK